jgi:hypothetical protein
MKRIVILIVASLFVVIGLFILFRVLFSVGPKGKGALQVTSNTKATVYLNDKPLGDTPLCKCNQGDTLDTGTYTIKVVPADAGLDAFTTKVEILPNVLTAVDRTFAPGAFASAYTLTLQKKSGDKAEILVQSLPDGAIVTIDGNQEQVTPYLAQDVSASEHDIQIQKSGFTKKTIRVRAVPGYRLIVNAILGSDSGTVEDQFKNASPTPSGTPTPKPGEEQININDTPTGFLRVRSGPSTTTDEIGRVEPGEIYTIQSEENGWYQIKLKSGDNGWISGQFATKKETP